MLTRQVTIPNRLGLHARAAAKLVTTASRFASEVFLEKEENRVNGKSIMGVMMLAAGKGSRLTLITDGLDEYEAMEALYQLIQGGFGEEE